VGTQAKKKWYGTERRKIKFNLGTVDASVIQNKWWAMICVSVGEWVQIGFKQWLF
jgi:hypothetical protein